MNLSRAFRQRMRRLVRGLPTDLAAAWLIAGLSRTLRLETGEAMARLPTFENGGPMLFAFWHNRILVMPWLYQRLFSHRRLKVMISASRDGQWITDVAARFGVEAARGSSSQGGAKVLISMTRELKRSGCDLAVTPDGPRGPRYVVQPGVALLARRTGLPVVPLSVHFERKWEMKSWDRFQIPQPFTKGRLVVGEPFPPPDDDQPNEVWCEELARRIGT